MVASSSLLLILASAASAAHVAHFTARCARTVQPLLILGHDCEKHPSSPRRINEILQCTGEGLTVSSIPSRGRNSRNARWDRSSVTSVMDQGVSERCGVGRGSV